ncbi:MAG: SDR family NAD(P)-dependent oxidoreductase [Symploca sp. SIO2E9]|nr:SDR family NAD(P)-dependent oxidoreductase [Symploca sp. SIO2E9]
MNEPDLSNYINELDIAIIGMSCRVPGAKDINTFWQNLLNGVESISFFSDSELESVGIDRALLNNPNYVKAFGKLSDIELFDASFFGFSAKEAQIMDPQHRLFLECAWEAIERAGYDPERYEGSIGVYAGAGMNTYVLNNLAQQLDLSEPAANYQVMVGNDKDYLPTRISYKLNLTGPSINIQTACSTSLVAVHLACQSLLNNECDMTLAGGVSVLLPNQAGYLYQEGMILSPDGHCRAFDAQAQGTVGGNGLGIVVLKRLADAIADGDEIHAVIKGSAINNDGSRKVGYTAPSVDRQAAVICETQDVAGIDAETITYIEAHGTGTTLGDPIEIAALTKAFRASTQKQNFCAIGSVKTNFGHLNTAAGVIGLIKTVLALKHKLLPPTLHFEQPNPKIDFANSPFYVNNELSEWKANGTPRRAGVSSFGIGGTNAHVILEEAPPVEKLSNREVIEQGNKPQLLLLSAKTSSALETATTNLAEYFTDNPEINLTDVAYTLSVGRQVFNYRRIVICQDAKDGAIALQTLDPQRVFTNFQESTEQSVTFMFSGQGSQYVNMALELYQVEPRFRQQVDQCSELLQPHLGIDLRDLLYPTEQQSDQAAKQLQQTAIAQPALFVIEYALAKLWMSLGVNPQAMIGHSIGEYVAACLAGVFSLEDALSLVAARGQMMQQLPAGAMLAVPLPDQELQSLLAAETFQGISLQVAAINGPSQCVVSGSIDSIETLQKQLVEQGVECRKLHTSHAFHSEMMEPILEPFTERVKQLSLKPPQIPYLSNVTGTWITAEEATDPSYWAKHLRQTVRFAEALQQLLSKPEQIMLEVGPGRNLSTLAKRNQDQTVQQTILTSVRHPKDNQSDVAFLLTTLGKLWLAGVQLDWSRFYAHQQSCRLSLPTYPFESKRYWIEPSKQAKTVKTKAIPGKKQDIADWFYIPSWKRSIISAFQENSELAQSCTLVFLDEWGLGCQLAKQLELKGHNVITVKVGSEFAKLNEGVYTLNPQQSNDYHALLSELGKLNKHAKTVVHLWSVTPNNQAQSVDKAQDLGFYSLLFLAQAIDKQNLTHRVQLAVVSNNLQLVTGDELICPEKTTLLGPVKVIPQEYSSISCRSIDIILPQAGKSNEQLIDLLLEELQANTSEQVIAYRNYHRWVQTFEAIHLNASSQKTTQLKEGGVYLITGGLGGIGLVLAEHLAKTVQAKLILTGRSTLPSRDSWQQWLETHDEQDPVSLKIRKVQELEKLGAEVLVVSADVANQQQMQAVVSEAQERFGQLNGVIHAAGIIPEMSFIRDADQANCEPLFQPKVYGLLVLSKVVEGVELDFCLLLSSLSSVLGGLGFAAYSAVNIFMDAFVQQHNQTSPLPWISVNWDGWQLQENQQQNPSWGSALAKFAIAPNEGVNAFERILSQRRISQIVVSTGDLQTRINQWLKLDALQESDTSEPEASTSSYTRPSLLKPYVAPANELEQTLASIWEKLLGLEQVGRDDNFFEQGGDSLVAIQVISRLRTEFPEVNLSPNILFEAPTVTELAEKVETILWATQATQNQDTAPESNQTSGNAEEDREQISF